MAVNPSNNPSMLRSGMTREQFLARFAERNAAIIEAYLAGTRRRDLRKLFGVSKGTVSGILNRLRNPAPKKPPVARASRKTAAPPHLTLIAAAGVPLDDVQATGGCRWAVSPETGPMHFCGAPRERAHLPFLADPAPYCDQHCKKARGGKPINSILAAERMPARMAAR